ncbi:virulence factor SrfB [Roseomonas sp. NAR14]|uniref:Virulence factor SrfB n=1 Tax=Roseomonas acroporae TaxID=2937791 RepID=A0A9X2BUS5_9PROT|nr:virulence factor SrfB [Roseomonas acroporae]MCK8785923.1 virulence factor SrfB [Roseomonas acroporae]
MIEPHSALPPFLPGSDVPLVPNSGVQFLDAALPLERVRLRRNWFELPRGEGLAALKALRDAPDEGGYAWDENGQAHFVAMDEEGRFDIDATGALEPFLGRWVPLPYLQVEVDGPPGRRRFAPGPENWARIRVVKLAEKEPDGRTHRAVLAFDTTTAARLPGAGFLTPWNDEPARFALASTPAEAGWLLDREWMRGWLAELYRERDIAGRALAPDAEIGCRHLAAYLTFLAVLEESGALPPIRLIDLATAERTPGGVIEVDLVLDLGNSRSCGFLVERTAGRAASLSDSYRLALRDLSAPEETSNLPFESRVEFARAGFGKEEWSLQSGRGTAFDWPSPVRVGPEAARLSSRNRGNEGQTGLSSPKRYLWDEAPVLTPWRFNPASDPEGAIRGGFLRFVSEDGTVLSMKRRGGIALRPLFSRASLFTFFLLEVLLQARAQVNGYAARYGRQDLAAPRRLGRLILTLPPALPPEEVRKVRERANAAAYLLEDVTGTRGRQKRLEVEARLDEATATQIVYLYDQISHAYRGDAPAYLDLIGRRRPPGTGAEAAGQEAPSLRIASIDVGGGTTDLAIYTYTLADRVVVPREDFREGFRLAGDDVLETVVMRHVLPGLRRALAGAGNMGMARAQHFLLSLFRRPADTEPERQARRLALNHVLAPAALGLLAEYEGWSPLAAGGVETRTLGALLAVRAPAGLRALDPEARAAQGGNQNRGQSREAATVRAAAWLDARAAEAGAIGFRTEAAEIELDFAAIHETVRRTLRDALDPLCEIVHRFGCDVLLLSGRGARWPAVQDLVTASLAVEPDRVQPMHHYRVGAWYPHADATGRISDPKTTVAVGAMLCRLLRDGQLDNLALVDKFGMRSTARYVGLMENDGRIRADRVLFSGLDLDSEEGGGEMAERTLPFSGRCFLGFKQFRAERWPASPLYRIEFASPEAAQGIALPLQVTLRRSSGRAPDGGEATDFEIDESRVFDARGNRLAERTVRRRLQTLRSEDGSYWLDTGQLATLDAVLGALA